MCSIYLLFRCSLKDEEINLKVFFFFEVRDLSGMTIVYVVALLEWLRADY